MNWVRTGLLSIAVLMGALSPAHASGPWPHIFVGGGYDDPNDKTGSPTGTVMLGFAGGGWAPFKHTGGRYDFIASMRVRPRATAEVTFDGDGFVGGGIGFEVHLWSPVFLEVSFQPGLYYRDGDTYVPQFRSEIGFGTNITNRLTVGAFANHKSNGKLGREDSSVETLLLRFGWAY